LPNPRPGTDRFFSLVLPVPGLSASVAITVRGKLPDTE
jgi:hypothetical protein